MDGDLSLSQSLGGLRIANPDDGSSPPPVPDARHAPAEFQPTPNSITPVIPGQSSTAEDHIPPVSSLQLDFDPNAYSTEKTTSPISRQHSENTSKDTAVASSRRNAAGPPSQSTVGHYGQQPTTFTQYSNSLPQTSPQYTNAPSQPSTYSGQPVSHGSFKEDMHRSQNVESQPVLVGGPRRQGSREATTALQPGIPQRESSQPERAYRKDSSTRPNGTLPPRRSSRNVNPGGAATSGGGSHGMEGPLPRTNEEWRERGAATGVRQEIDANGRPIHRYVKKGVNDFHFGRTLGEGSYSTVMLGTDRQTGKEYAIKILAKRHIIKEKKVKYVNIEKDTLNRLTEHPGIVKLYYTFQDQASLYFVLDLATGGELLGVLKKMGTFDVECTRFYGAQILDTVDYMHSKGVIHRDLKPENVLLDARMNIKITDFGTAKVLQQSSGQSKGSNSVPVPGDHSDGDESGRATSFVGTAEYVSPELLTEKNAGKASDLWAFGCIIYQLLAGRPPFKAATEYLTFEKIIALDYSFPSGYPPVARDLVERLLVLDPSQRLTMDHVKNHEFFDGIKWGRGLWHQKVPRLKSYQPPAHGPIKLNGVKEPQNGSYPPDIGPSHSAKPVRVPGATHSNGNSNQLRSTPRLITEIPPPSQLDIEWSPVLTRSHERILKFSNQLVLCTTVPTSPGGKNNSQPHEGNKFSRLFGGGGASKKRQRLIMVTSSGRVLICGDDKKIKFDIPITDALTTWKKLQDSKGFSYWVIETRDKHFAFEDPKASASDSSTTSASADDWIEHIEKAREMAASQGTAGADTADDSWRNVRQASPSSNSNTLDRGAERRAADSTSASRQTLQKHPSSNNTDEPRGFKRFSRRQSKSGLAAVF